MFPTRDSRLVFVKVESVSVIMANNLSNKPLILELPEEGDGISKLQNPEKTHICFIHIQITANDCEYFNAFHP